MRSTMLRAALLLCASSLLTGVFACESPGSDDGAYREGGGNQRVNLPEEVQQGPSGRGVEMNVETGDEGEREDAPGRQEESTPQASGSSGGAASGRGDGPSD